MNGVKIEVHHITPQGSGGDDSSQNAIALCFNCHADVEHYNTQHPRGRKFTASELKRHRDQHIELMNLPPTWVRAPIVPQVDVPVLEIEDLLDEIRSAELWRPELAEELEPRILALDRDARRELLTVLNDLLASDDRDVSWNAAIVIERLIQWEPTLVTDDTLLRMSEHTVFSVRSSAAVAYYWLALCAPERVPVEVLGKLASIHEDWYVMAPATSALICLARTRPVAVDLLARGLDDPSADVRNHSASVLRRLGRQWPSALRDDIANRMRASNDQEVRSVGDEWMFKLKARHEGDDTPLDSYMF